MATALSKSREMARLATAVPAEHIFACRARFISSVLPHFPEARSRFERHFFDSYSLIRSLPDDGAFPFGLAMTALGVQGLEVPKPPLSNHVLTNLDAFRAAGLGCRMRHSGELEVYSRELVGPVLSGLFSTSACSTSAIEAGLGRFEERNQANPRGYPYSLLAWPSLVKPGQPASLTLTLRIGKSMVECASDALASALMNLRAIDAAMSFVKQVRNGAAGCADSCGTLFAADA